MDEAVIKRVMPHDSLAELSVIGCMILDTKAINTARDIISGRDFYEKQYGMIFDTIADLYDSSQPVDVVTLQNKLKEKDAPEEISSLEFLEGIIDSTITSANVKHYAEMVRDKALYRRLIGILDRISADCYEPKAPIDEIFEKAEKDIFDIVQKRNTGEYTPIRDIVAEALRRMQRIASLGGGLTGTASGFKDLDEMTSGFQPSDLILIAARPSMGKTAFVLNIAEYVTLRENKCVAIFSLEMSKEQLINRLISVDSMVEATKIREASFEDNEAGSIVETANKLAGSKLIIDDTSNISLGALQSKCRKFKLEMGLDMVIIDYLQLMSVENTRKNDSRQNEVSAISRGLKALARELNVPVIALSQLSRDVEKRENKRPILSDLRESGAIEQDADVVMFLYREDYYKKDTEDKNVAEVILAKQRNGPIGSVKLTWLGKYTKFVNREKDRNKNDDSE
ncbi:MAG: replicative DNA helicase [Lachnospiraceae bacterium]|nr:replicative DNA helicase [Lachnospiraceae bacterium]